VKSSILHRGERPYVSASRFKEYTPSSPLTGLVEQQVQPEDSSILFGTKISFS
jgi:hypothetical protein